MNDIPDTPGARLVTILASDPQPGRVDCSRIGRRSPADTEPRPSIPLKDIEVTRAELAELRRRTTHRTA